MTSKQEAKVLQSLFDLMETLKETVEHHDKLLRGLLEVSNEHQKMFDQLIEQTNGYLQNLDKRVKVLEGEDNQK